MFLSVICCAWPLITLLSQDIHSGSDWHNAIGGGLYSCRAILPVITEKYLSSSYCIKELYTADGDRKHIFPLMYEDVDFDKDQGAQGVKFTISSINWTMCRPDKDDYNTSISRLIQHLKEQGGEGVKETREGGRFVPQYIRRSDLKRNSNA